MNVLITGNAGFVGSHLADRLVAEGHKVFGIDNLETGRRENVSDGVDFEEGTLLSGLHTLFPKVDLIIHCAASYKDPDAWLADQAVNICGAEMVARFAQTHNARIFYFQTVLPPISSYAISKIAGEHYLRLSGQPLTVFRLASVYGPRNLSGAIPAMYKRLKAGKPCTVVEGVSRDFVYIEDLVDLVMWSVEAKPEGSFDVGTGVETPVIDLPGMIGEALGVEPTIKLQPLSVDDVPKFDMTPMGVSRLPSKIRERIKDTVAWYEQHGVEIAYTHLALK